MFTFEDQPPPARQASPVSAPAVQTKKHIDAGYLSKAKVPYVDNQRALIESDHPVTAGIALAGTGKTSTAVGYTDARPHLRTLYLAFNTENAAEGRQRFGRHVTARTPHSIAFSMLSQEQRARATHRWNAMTVRNALSMRNYRAAATVCAIINDFCVSDDEHFDSLRHGYSAIERLGVDHSLVERCVGMAQSLWQMMWQEGSAVPISHDAYFKRFVMKRPNLGVDLLIFDEAQDANAVTAQLVRTQAQEHGTRVLYLGDEHQSIYAFRGAVNAMRNLPESVVRYPLTQSWRFGPRTATLANLVLSQLKNETLELQGMGSDKTWDPSKPYAYLARTNAELIAQAVASQGEGIYWVGGIERYRVDMLLDVWRLANHLHHQIQDKFISNNFNSWDDYEKVAMISADPEMRIMVKLIEDYEDDIPEIVDQLKDKAERQSKDSQLILTTAHRAKGLEFDQVQVGEDFKACEDAELWLSEKHHEAPYPEQEVNLLYVALTRAKSYVKSGSDMAAWYRNLQTHLENRVSKYDPSQAPGVGYPDKSGQQRNKTNNGMPAPTF